MNNDEYLESVVAAHEVTETSAEAVAALSLKNDVEALIRSQFVNAVPVIEIAGSYVKGTMIRDHYDLDVICYFQNTETEAGDTLEEIYGRVEEILSSQYEVTPKNAALLLSTKDENKKNLHVDVVPGRFIDETQTDCFLYQNDGDKNRLQTNLRTHIDHVKHSELTKVIKLAKYWRHRRGLDEEIRTFVLELAVIEVLKEKSGLPISEQMKILLTVFRDDVEGIHVVDPANEAGNDLSKSFSAEIRNALKVAASTSLETLGSGGWAGIFPDTSMLTALPKATRIARVVEKISYPSKPWAA